MFISTAIGIAVAIIVVAIIISLVIIVVSLIRNKEKSNAFSLKSLLRVYLYFMCLVTLLISIIGASYLVKSLLSYAFGFQFSYYVSEIYDDYEPYTGKTIEIEGRSYNADYNQRTQDLINGTTLFVSLIILFIIHRGALYILEKSETEPTAFRKVYLFTSLTVYSLISIIAIPVGIYETISYILYQSDGVHDYYSRPIPGEALAVAIVTFPLWIAFLTQILITHRKEEKTNI